jgi:two-component system chemotaxis response regulator CheB
MGASDTLPKPGTGRFNGTFSDVLLTKLRALGRPEAGALTRRPVPATVSSFDPALLRRMAEGPVRLLGLGASTGGIHALASFFETLPTDIGVPIVVTQHLPAPFMPVFARQLGVAAKREALVAEEGIRLLPDRILVAPGDANLTIDISAGRMVVRLDDRRSASGCLPSVDPMFSSAGNLLGSEALGVVFTGMGRDGLEGARHMVATGGSVLVQDAATSAVWGMPRAIADAGLACGVHPPVDLARRVANRIREGSCK